MFDQDTQPPLTPDTPPMPPPPGPGMSVTSLISMIVGLLGLPISFGACCCLPVGLVGAFVGLIAVITGHIGYVECKKNPEKASIGFAITGLICGYLAIVIGALLFVLILVGVVANQGANSPNW